MVEYIYKGFKISYIVKSANFENDSFKADGSLTYLRNKPKIPSSKKFQTEYTSYDGAEHEIKKLLENYVDFELKNYKNMKNEKNYRQQPRTEKRCC